MQSPPNTNHEQEHLGLMLVSDLPESKEQT